MGKCKVLIIGNDHIPSYKIGIFQPFNHLKEQGLCHFEVKSEEGVPDEAIAWADVVIFFRTSRPEAYQLLERAHEMGKKTIFSIDDHFLAIPPTTGIGQSYADPAYRKTFTKFLKNAQIVKVASDFFADHIRTHFNPKEVVSFPGSVDFSYIDQLDKPERKEDEQIIIGYAGGKKEGSFEPVVPALRRILREYGDKVRLEFCGFIPHRLEGRHNVKHTIHDTDYKRFLKHFYQRGWDIGLAPLEETLLHDCKTNNRFREYAACGIPGIYSASPAYKNWVDHRETGYLVPQTEEGWYEGIVEMIENSEMRQRIKKRTKSMARQHFTIEACVENWRKYILNI